MRFIAMPTIDLTNEERAAVTTAIRRLIEEDKSQTSVMSSATDAKRQWTRTIEAPPHYYPS
jgi:hypothetical protein